MFPYDEDEKKKAIQEYLIQKYPERFKQLNDERSKALEEFDTTNKPSAGKNILGGLLSAMRSKQTFEDWRDNETANTEKQRNQLTKTYDDKQKALRDEFGFEKEQADLEYTQKKRSREDEQYELDKQDRDALRDVNSSQSEFARELAKKMLPGKDFSQMSGEQIFKVLPSLQKLYEIDQRRLDREESRRITESNKRDKEDEKTQRKFDTDMQKFSSALDKKGIPEMEGALDRIDLLVQQATDKKGNVDLPGYGYKGGMLPNWLTSKDGKELRTNIQGLANTLLKSRSGAAVSDQEYRRFLKELSAGTFGDEQTLLVGLQKMREDVNNIKSNLAQGYGPNIVKEYQERQGVIPEGFIKEGKNPERKGATSGWSEKPAQKKAKAGDIVIVKGKKYRVLEDGDSLEEVK